MTKFEKLSIRLLYAILQCVWVPRIKEEIDPVMRDVEKIFRSDPNYRKNILIEKGSKDRFNKEFGERKKLYDELKKQNSIKGRIKDLFRKTIKSKVNNDENKGLKEEFETGNKTIRVGMKFGYWESQDEHLVLEVTSLSDDVGTAYDPRNKGDYIFNVVDGKIRIK